jgi:hypothetical protein
LKQPLKHELSLGFRVVDDVVNQLRTFQSNAPLQLYHYHDVINLIDSAKNCPSDAVSHILLIAGDLLTFGNIPRNTERKEILDTIGFHLKNRTQFPEFGKDQRVPRSELRRLHALFKGVQCLKHHQIQRYDTRKIERIKVEQPKLDNETTVQRSRTWKEKIAIAITITRTKGRRIRTIIIAR